MLLRIVSAFGVALIYAVFAGGFTVLFWRMTNPRYSGPMIPNNEAWGLFLVILVTVIGAAVAVVVALIVSLAGVDQRRGAFIGGGIGLALFLRTFINGARSNPKTTRQRLELLQILLFYFVVFPVGLSFTGIAASVVAGQLPEI